MRELLEPILYVSFAIFAVSSAIIMPILLYAAWRTLIKGEQK